MCLRQRSWQRPGGNDSDLLKTAMTGMTKVGPYATTVDMQATLPDFVGNQPHADSVTLAISATEVQGAGVETPLWQTRATEAFNE